MDNNNVKVGVSNKEGQLGFVFTRGGLREGSGRKSIGVTKKVSLTLTEEMWEELAGDCTNNNISRSEAIRNIIEAFYTK